ncbi:MAG: 6,7-dimethyl-8-ribityllumazine synthase [Candidatus Peregrinibacteria bacterium]|nr:6,7-dimethyl-8-ribityllumazine synthase [Candidatus Peregrinibacteria bacterium]
MKLHKSDPKKSSIHKNKSLKIAIILPRFNDELGQKLLMNTQNELKELGIKNVQIYRVPGALELPFAAQKIALSKKYNAIIALGIVVRGETKHFDLVTEHSHSGLMQVSLTNKLPIIFGVLAVENEKQAIERVEEAKMNKGKEFAQAAVEMATFRA